MSQDIADMPGIEAAMARFNAITGSNGAADAAGPVSASGSATGQSSTDTRPSSLRYDAASEQAIAGPTAGRQSSSSALPNNGEAQNSVSSSEVSLPSVALAKAGAKGDTSPTDTLAAPETAATTTTTNRDDKGRFTKPGEGTRPAETDATQKPDEKSGQSGSSALPQQEKTRYAKAQERLDKTWEVVNKRKTELDSQATSLEQQRLTLDRDKAQFEAIRRQAEQPSVTPEQALQASQQRRRDADALRMQAKRAEDAGRFDEAQRLNKQADKAESLADELTDYSEQLRKNPPVSMQQRQQQFEQARKQWTLEACNAFPDLGTHGSRLQQVVAQHLNALAKQDPQLMVHPSLIYHVARLADAQIKVTDLQTVAARVPGLEKEAESLRARIKELEAATTPAGNGGVARLGEPAQDDYVSLRQSAVEMGHGRW